MFSPKCWWNNFIFSFRSQCVSLYLRVRVMFFFFILNVSFLWKSAKYKVFFHCLSRIWMSSAVSAKYGLFTTDDVGNCLIKLFILDLQKCFSVDFHSQQLFMNQLKRFHMFFFCFSFGELVEKPTQWYCARNFANKIEQREKIEFNDNLAWFLCCWTKLSSSKRRQLIIRSLKTITQMLKSCWSNCWFSTSSITFLKFILRV